MYTYVCTAATPVYTQPHESASVALNGQAALKVGQTFAGQPDTGAMVWMANGLGFVPARAVTLCYQFEGTWDTPVRQSPDPHAPIAEQHGSALILKQGMHANGAYAGPAWVWLIDGSGFVEASATRVIADTLATVDMPATSGTPPAPPSNEPVQGVTYVTQPDDTLWSIAEHFYGDGTRWHEIYAVPQNRQAIGDDPRHINAGKHLVIPGATQ